MVSTALKTRSRRLLPRALSQEQVVLGVVIVLFVVFSAVIPSFRSFYNLTTMLRSICVLGILGTGMGIVVIARGIDLSQIAIMAVSSAASIELMQQSTNAVLAVVIGLGLAVLLGVFNGFLVSFVEIPALFTTLATSLLFLNGARSLYLPSLIIGVPKNASFITFLGQGNLLGIPMPIIVFVVVAVLAQIFLSRTSLGRFIYAHGDNAEAAAITGIPVRPLTIFEYTLSAVIGFVAGLVQAGTIAEMDTQIALGSMIFDVILVVVLGGISLVGGRGGVLSVVVGALLVGVMTNGMTLLNLNNDVQSVALGLILLGAIILDNRLHPRDEETAKQGD